MAKVDLSKYGITGTTDGGIFAPIVGWAADIWGLTAALQILWIAGILGAIAAFTLKNPAMEKAK